MKRSLIAWVAAGRRVHVAAGTMDAGPIAEAPLQVGGWFVIDVADLQSALVWASRAPSSTRGGIVEVRPLVALPSMAR